MSELKPCPFCEGEIEHINIFPLGEGHNVRCSNKCTEYMSQAQWNTRPIEDALKERVRELEQRFSVSCYNAGYMAGHHDTVEGAFTDMLPQDVDTFHADIVGELIEALLEGKE